MSNPTLWQFQGLTTQSYFDAGDVGEQSSSSSTLFDSSSKSSIFGASNIFGAGSVGAAEKVSIFDSKTSGVVGGKEVHHVQMER